MGMGMKVFWVTVAAVLGQGAIAADVSSNVYVRLYESRLEFARVQARKRAQELKYELVQLARQEKLYQRRATSAAELELHQRNAKVAELALEDSKVQVQEAEIMRDIAKERVSLGLEMPICPGSPVQ